MPVVTRLQAKKQQEFLKEKRAKERQELFDKLGLEIIQKGYPEYLGRGACGKDDLSWREWVIDHINRGSCPYN